MSQPEPGQPIPADALKLPLLNEAGESIDLEKAISGQLTVLFFLRHFGCIACKQRVAMLQPRLGKFEKLGARVLLIGNGQVKHLGPFIERTELRGTAATVLTDPTKKIYDAFGFTRSIGSNLNPSAVVNALMAFGEGHMQTTVEGDPMQQGGVVITLPDGTIKLLHRERAMGDFLGIASVLKQTERSARAMA